MGGKKGIKFWEHEEEQDGPPQKMLEQVKEHLPLSLIKKKEKKEKSECELPSFSPLPLPPMNIPPQTLPICKCP